MTVPIELVIDPQAKLLMQVAVYTLLACVALQTLAKMIECWRGK